MTGAMLTHDAVFIGDSPLFFCRRLYTSIFERPRRLQDERSWCGRITLRKAYRSTI
jgi:hypothetical protein